MDDRTRDTARNRDDRGGIQRFGRRRGWHSLFDMDAMHGNRTLFRLRRDGGANVDLEFEGWRLDVVAARVDPSGIPRAKPLRSLLRLSAQYKRGDNRYPGGRDRQLSAVRRAVRRRLQLDGY